MPLRKSKQSQDARGKVISLVRKSHDLVEAKYLFDIWETRFFLTLISKISHRDSQGETYRIYFRDIKQAFDIRSNQSYDLLRTAALGLADKSVYVRRQGEEGTKRGRKLRLIRFVDFLEKDQDPGVVTTERHEYVDVSIDKDLYPYLLAIRKNFDPQLHRYTSYDLFFVRKLRPYGVRMYELLKQFEFRGERTLDVDEIRTMFELENQYKKFSHFYTKVIESSVNDINQHSDLCIPKVERIKRGRKIVALRFTILSKTEAEIEALRGDEPDALPSPTDEDPLEVQVRRYRDTVIDKFAVSERAFRKLLQEGFADEQIERAIQLTHRTNYQKRIKSSRAAFFVAALRNGFTDERAERERELRERAAELERSKQELKQLRTERAQLVLAGIRKLTEDAPEVVAEALEAIRDNAIYASLLQTKEETLERPISVQDFREDAELYRIMMATITDQNQAYLDNHTFATDERIAALRNHIKTLKAT